MKKFRSMQELLAYMAGIEIPNELKNATTKNSVKDYTNALYYGVTGTLMSIFDKASIKMVCQNIADDLNFAKYRAIGEFFEKLVDILHKPYFLLLCIFNNAD